MFKRQARLSLIGTMSNQGLYTIQLTSKSIEGNELAAVSLEEWHKRFGHASVDSILQLSRKDSVVGLDFKSKTKESCQPCNEAKITRVSHPPRASTSASETTAILHLDTCGPFRRTSLGGSKYFLIAVEKYSKYILISFVANKAQIPNGVKRIIHRVEVESKGPVKLIHSDNRTEFRNQSLESFLLDKGILQKFSAPYTPQQNGLAERSNRSILDFVETFSPVVKMDTVPVLLLILANHFRLKVIQMDVKTAFLHGSLKETIFMNQPEGYHKGNNNQVCKLNKAIYGLKQASLAWNVCFTNFLKEFSLRPLKNDKCQI